MTCCISGSNTKGKYFGHNPPGEYSLHACVVRVEGAKRKRLFWGSLPLARNVNVRNSQPHRKSEDESTNFFYCISSIFYSLPNNDKLFQQFGAYFSLLGVFLSFSKETSKTQQVAVENSKTWVRRANAEVKTQQRQAFSTIWSLRAQETRAFSLPKLLLFTLRCFSVFF